MQPQRLTEDQVNRAEAAIARIRGVATCRVSVDPDGAIETIHVVTDSDKPARLVARDVESCLAAELGLVVDHRKIGVVRIDPTSEAEAADESQDIAEFAIEEHPSRFSFQSVNVFQGREGVRVEVELTRDGAEAFGASQSESAVADAGLIAEAALRAVGEFLDDDNRLCLSGALTVSLGGVDAVVVRVDLKTALGAKALVGCAIVSGNHQQAAVFASLDAVNRIVGKLEFKSSIEYKIR